MYYHANNTDALGNNTVDVIFNHMSFQVYGNCRGRLNNLYIRDLDSPYDFELTLYYGALSCFTTFCMAHSVAEHTLVEMMPPTAHGYFIVAKVLDFCKSCCRESYNGRLHQNSDA